MAKHTKEDIRRICEEQNVKYIRLQFTDILGTIKNVEIPVSQLEKAMDNKMMFDGSSIEGFVRIEESDMYLYPDLDTFVVFPWTAEKGWLHDLSVIFIIQMEHHLQETHVII